MLTLTNSKTFTLKTFDSKMNAMETNKYGDKKCIFPLKLL